MLKYALSKSLPRTSRCILCKKTKPISEFSITQGRWANSYCKPCTTERNRDYLREKYRTDSEWRKSEIDRIKKFRKDKPMRERARVLRSRARVRGIELDRDYFTMDRLVRMQERTPDCKICGFALSYAYTGNTKYSRACFVRRNAAKGYVRHNVRIICRGCRDRMRS